MFFFFFFFIVFGGFFFNGQFPLFGDALNLENSQNSLLHHSFVEEIKSAGPDLERLARDSGLMSEKGSIPTLLTIPTVVVGPPPPLSSRKDQQQQEQQLLLQEQAAVEEPEFQEESSASYTSPVKRGRGKVRAAQNTSSKRSKSRRSKSGGSQSSQTDKASQTKGLRHFSLAVCNKVRDKGVTTYNEVADELVTDFDDEEGKNDEKNIRRRVYDALNVLSAMDIIRKVKKEIHWVGLPANLDLQLKTREDEFQSRADRVAKKEEHLQELQHQLHLYKSLIERNAKRPVPNDDKLALPFIIVNADNRSRIDLRVSADRTEYVFDFTNPFEVHEKKNNDRKFLFFIFFV